VAAQTYPQWEAVVVDDQSSDDTLSAVHQRFVGEPRIRLFSRRGPTGGAPICRNQAFHHSEGRYLIFLDSDDLLTPGCVAHRVDTLLRHPELDFVVFPTLQFYEKPGDCQVLWNIDRPGVSDLDRFLWQDVPWSIMGPIWRREALLRLGGFTEELRTFQDWELHLRACIQSLRYAKAGKPDNYWRHPGKRDTIGSHWMEPEVVEGRKRALQLACEWLKDANLLVGTRRNYGANLFYRNAAELLEKGQPGAWGMWTGALATGCVTRTQLLAGWLVLRTRNIPKVGKALRLLLTATVLPCKVVERQEVTMLRQLYE